jgi:hypothetical protein
MVVLDVVAAYNREGLPLPPEGRGVNDPSAEEMMAHPYYWAYLSDSDTEDVLMRLYINRRTRTQ